MAFTYKPLPSSPCAWEWDTGTSRIRQALGFKNSKIPADFHGTFKIDGWKVVIKRGTKGAQRKTAAHRIFIDNGGRLIPAGRVNQALCRVSRLQTARRRRRARPPLSIYRR
jgi:hypothetical protein